MTKIHLYGGGGKQWSELIHNGPMFPSLYIPHNIPIYIDGKAIKLPPLAEEYITMYARYIDTEYAKNPRFNKNFLYDFKKETGIKIDNLDKINIDDIKKYLNKLKEEKANMTKEMKLM